MNIALNKVKKHQGLLKLLAVSIAVVFLFLGCANMANSVGIDTSNASSYDEQLATGHYKEAADLSAQDKDPEAQLDEANLLSTLEAGNAYLYAKDYDTSIKMLNESEAIIKFHHEEILASSAADYLAEIAVNDAAIDYHATMTDAIMVNTYKSINLMMQGKVADARVELNRAVDRQRRAKNTYAELIGKQKEAIDEKRKVEAGKEATSGFSKTVDNKGIQDLVKKNYSSLYEFKAYPDFINPFTTYLAGLFFLIEGDYSKSSSLLKEAYGMMPNNRVVKSDFNMVENALSGNPIKKHYVWVIYENGLGPVKEQYQLNIPLYLVSDEVTYTGIALPKMVMRNKATSDLTVVSSGRVFGKTELVADMDRVMLTEFKYTYNDILTRAVLSTFIKTFAQYEAKRYGGAWAGLAAAAFQFLSTQADKRIWSSMPKDFEVARVKMPVDHKLVLQAGSHHMDVQLGSKAKHSIVYVRIPTSASTPSVSVANF